MMHTSTRLVALAVLVGLLAIGVPVAAAETELDAHGWWWRAQAGATELPAPPWVPEDGLAVANDLEGPSAIAAVRYDIDAEDVAAAALTLDVADEQGGDLAAIRACPAVARWRGAQAGTWQHRPSGDCDAGQASGVRDGESGTWTFDVSMLVADGVLNVILLPDTEIGEPEGQTAPTPSLPEAPGGEGGATFQIAFEPPDGDSLEVSGQGSDFEVDEFGTDAGVAEVSPETTSGAEPREGSPPPVGDATPIPSRAVDDSGAAGGRRTSPPPDVAAPEQPAPQRQDATALVAPPQDDRSAMPPTAVEPAGFGDDLGRQAAALVALLTGFAAVVLLRGSNPGTGGIHGLRRSLIVRPEVAESAVSGAGAHTATPRGLGRFARPREGAPPPL